MTTDLWSSARLIYRSIDNEDADFIAELDADPDAFLNVATSLPGINLPAKQAIRILGNEEKPLGLKRMHKMLGNPFSSQFS